MNKNELDLILQEGEGYKLEFKENITSDLAKEMTAFANSSGGRIFIGVYDSNEVKGINISNSLYSKIQDAASSCDPPVSIKIQKYNNILIVNVHEGDNKPYRCSKGFYIRNGGNSQKLTTVQIREFMQNEGKIRFDEINREDVKFNKFFNPGLLNKYLIAANITKTTNEKTILANLNALELRKNRTIFNNAGLLFFSNNVINAIPQSSVICALYKGFEKVTILDRKEFNGSIIENIEDSILFLKKHLNLRYEITNIRRKEFLEIPEVALREAVINSVCHRDYFEKGANVMIEVFDDRVEITNPGGLPKALDKKDFGKRSIARNPVIASLLQRAGYVEKMGTGINRIKTAVKKSGGKIPLFKYDNFFSVTFKRDLPGTVSIKKAHDQSAGMSDKRRLSVGINVGNKLNEKESLLLELIEENSQITAAVLAEKLDVSIRTIERIIRNLREKGILLRVGPLRNGYWEIINPGETGNKIREPEAQYEPLNVGNSVGITVGINDTLKYELTGKVKENLTQLVALLINSPGLTGEKIARKLSVSLTTVKRYIKILKENNIIENRGAQKTGGYFITEKFNKRLRK